MSNILKKDCHMGGLVCRPSALHVYLYAQEIDRYYPEQACNTARLLRTLWAIFLDQAQRYGSFPTAPTAKVARPIADSCHRTLSSIPHERPCERFFPYWQNLRGWNDCPRGCRQPREVERFDLTMRAALQGICPSSRHLLRIRHILDKAR